MDLQFQTFTPLISIGFYDSIGTNPKTYVRVAELIGVFQLFEIDLELQRGIAGINLYYKERNDNVCNDYLHNFYPPVQPIRKILFRLSYGNSKNKF